MNILTFGPNGSGKGTQGAIVKEKYGMDHIESGAIFREHIKGGSELGKKAKEYILAGDVFQVVIGQRLSSPMPASPLAFYRALRRMNPSPFLYFLDFDDHSIVGSSPEILVRSREGIVTVRPIAGTRPRGKTKLEDIAHEKQFKNVPNKFQTTSEPFSNKFRSSSEHVQKKARQDTFQTRTNKHFKQVPTQFQISLEQFPPQSVSNKFRNSSKHSSKQAPNRFQKRSTKVLNKFRNKAEQVLNNLENSSKHVSNKFANRSNNVPNKFQNDTI